MNEFWGSFGYPQDSPHVVQGVGNSISPQEYYTEEIAGRALEEHQRWLGLELELLREAMRGHGSGIRKT
jgi:hypothetical protein